MKNQILEMLASPSVETVTAVLRTLFRPLQESPLIAAITAGALGLFAAMLIIGWRSRRRQRKANESWEARLNDLDKTHKSKLSELNDSKDSLGKQVETLQNKLHSLEKTLEQDRTTLHKVNANVKTLEVTAAEKDQKIQKTIDDAAHKIAEHQASLKKTKVLLKARTNELEELKAQKVNSTRLPISASLLTSINERDDGYAEQLAKRLGKLDQQRAMLLRERDELASREAHYADQLMDGSDTRAYLDETIAMGDELDQLASADALDHAATSEEFENTLAVDLSAANQPAVDHPAVGRSAQKQPQSPTEKFSEQLSAKTQSANPAAGQHDQTVTPLTLWDRVKTTVVKTTDKAKIEKTDA